MCFAGLALGVLALVACGGGGKGAQAPGEQKPDVDGDPLVLIPPAAIVVVRADAATVFSNPAVGGELASLASSFVPLGEDAGFHVAKDVDRVVAASYATSNMDVAAVLRGRFDVDRIAHATKTQKGAPITAGTYLGIATYTSGRVAWATLSAKTLIAGSPEGVQLVIDRVAKNKLDKWEPAWMTTTLETATAQVAVAGDLSSTPITVATIGALNLGWVKGVKQVRALGTLDASGLTVSGTLGFADAGQASDAAGGIKQADRLLDVFGPLLGGLRLQRFDVGLDGTDVRCSFAVDAQGLRTLLALAPRFIPGMPQ
jgi:hypothetical protein